MERKSGERHFPRGTISERNIRCLSLCRVIIVYTYYYCRKQTSPHLKVGSPQTILNMEIGGVVQEEVGFGGKGGININVPVDVFLTSIDDSDVAKSEKEFHIVQ